jgi:hypothetical protein
MYLIKISAMCHLFLPMFFADSVNHIDCPLVSRAGGYNALSRTSNAHHGTALKCGGQMCLHLSTLTAEWEDLVAT